jgi:hypothetical protein
VQIENQHPEKTLRFFLLSESRRTLPHPHNRLVIDSSPTGPTITVAAALERGLLQCKLIFNHAFRSSHEITADRATRQGGITNNCLQGAGASY